MFKKQSTLFVHRRIAYAPTLVVNCHEDKDFYGRKMADSRIVVKVFLASPGDLPDERRAAKSVVDDFNALYAEEFGYQVELVGWEDTVSVYGRPQATINRELERCELFVGLMWKRWGTPPDVSGLYSSGFEEEYETSIQRRVSVGRPEISLLFKEIDPDLLRDPGDDLKKVLAFKKKLIAEKKILFETFSDIREFERKLHRCISSYVIALRKREADVVSDQSQAPTTSGENREAAEASSEARETPLSVEGANFLREFISKTERDAMQEPIQPVEVARFRLLANLIGSQGNDERSLGVHDANILFAEGGNVTFGQRELTGLLVCGFEHYSNENAPLWHWLAAVNGFTRQLLPIYSVIGSSIERRVGALSAMRLISEPLPSEPPLDRKFYLDSWFDKDLEIDLKLAALTYLGDCGISTDITTIRRELDKNNNQTINAAAEAIIRINLRDSREKAISALYEIQPTSINQEVLAMLFDNAAALSTETLLNGVGHQNSNARRIVVELLRGRHALPNEVAEQLLIDSDAAVRYEALKSLMDAGHLFLDEDAKKVLIKQPQNSLFGTGVGRSGGEFYWDDFQLQRLRSLKDKELEIAAAEDPILQRNAQFILAGRHFNRYGESLRKSVDDQYKAVFSQALHTAASRFGEQVNLIEQLRSLENYIRKDLTRQGLDVICRNAKPEDLARVRVALKSGFIDYSAADTEYLRKFGEWEDIPLIIDSAGRPEAGFGSLLISAFDDSKYQTAARAIYALSRTRLSEVLTMQMPSKLLSHLIAETSEKAFRNLSDASIFILLRSESDVVRKTAALKCVRVLTKKRVAELLNNYVSGDQYRYYNVVHWLDFGVSTPRERALLAAEKALNKERFG